jgi:hypothetical protein
MGVQNQPQKGYGNRDGVKKFMGSRPTGAMKKTTRPVGKRINNIDPDPEDHLQEGEDEVDDEEAPEEEEVGFLGETL